MKLNIDSSTLQFPFIGTVTRLFGGKGRADRAWQSLYETQCRRFTLLSDQDLRNEFENLGLNIQGSKNIETLALFCSLVAEAIDRRLGAWQIFDPEFDAGKLTYHQRICENILDFKPYATNISYYTDDTYIESSQFLRSIDSWLDQTKMDRDDRTIVKSLVYVSEKSAADYHSNILLPANFYHALTAKDVDRRLAFRPSREQVTAGRLLFDGKVVEMNAGEGKTVASLFPAALYALLGKSVHIITANDYLAYRDAEWLAPVYESLGLTVSTVLSHMNEPERANAYRQQITYGTLREFGFDFLRDNLKYDEDKRIQKTLEVAIIDEVDHVLIDEAATPLIIAGTESELRISVHTINEIVSKMVEVQKKLVENLELKTVSLNNSGEGYINLLTKLYFSDPNSHVLTKLLSENQKFARQVRAKSESVKHNTTDNALTKNLGYLVGSRKEFVTLTEQGQDHIQTLLGDIFDNCDLERKIKSVETNEDIPADKRKFLCQKYRQCILERENLVNQIYQALQAHTILKRNTDYIVDRDEVILVDKFTGRRKPDNRYQHGLQSALEAKENVPIRGEHEVLAQMSVKGFVKQYSFLAGITGTALSSTDELRSIYGFDVDLVLPTTPSNRADLPTKIYASRQSKLNAIVTEIMFWKSVGRPVLVGTLTVEQSEEISKLLNQQSIDHQVLNAVHTQAEAKIVRLAGSFGATTIATNMAGRGTDITLDRNLNNRILKQYTDMIYSLETDGANRIEITCGTSEEAAILKTSLNRVPKEKSPSTKFISDKFVVVNTVQKDVPAQQTISLEFGLGMHIIGSEMNESSRIDRQLRGRCARQGEFGSSRFILSLEDPPFIHCTSLRYPKESDKKRDSLGGIFFEGKTVLHTLTRVQKEIETTDEVNRARMLDYTRVTEHLTLSYYRARTTLIKTESLHLICFQLTKRLAQHLLAKHFKLNPDNQYMSRFEALANALWVDYQIDCDHLWGMGTNNLQQKLHSLLFTKLNLKISQLADQGLSGVEKTILLEVSDEFWRYYILKSQDLMLSTQISSWDHRSALSNYILRSISIYREYMETASDAFVLKILNLDTNNVPETETVKTNIVEDIEAILV